MGSSSSLVNGLHMWFKAAKSWQLGWCLNTKLVFDMENIRSGEHCKLLGTLDYDKVSEDECAGVKLTNDVNNFDNHVSFNAKSGTTSETEYGENKAIIIKLPSNSTHEDSCLVNRLGLFGKNELHIRKDTKGIKIMVNKITTDSLPFHTFFNHVYSLILLSW